MIGDEIPLRKMVSTDMIDMTSACQRTADVLANVTDDQLTAATPCESCD